MKKRWLEFLLHILFWFCTGWLITSSFSIQTYEVEMVNDVETVRILRSKGLLFQILLCIVVSAILFYANYLLLRNLNHKTIDKKSAVYSIGLFLMGLLISYLLVNWQLIPDEPKLAVHIAIEIVIFYYAISLAYSLGKLWLIYIDRQHQLVLDKKQTELSLLRNQLQPHFLFNALNNLLSMVSPKANPKLVHSFEKLSQLLRYVIEENSGERVSVKKEIEFIYNYIDLQLLRFNEGEVNITFDVEGPFEAQLVEPGIFIPFVENAFKYGTEPEKSSQIYIRFDLTNEHRILFEVKNKIRMSVTDSTGQGIVNTRKRLDLIYPEKHTIRINTDGMFYIHLEINTQ